MFRMKMLAATLLAVALPAFSPVHAGENPAAKGAEVYILSPSDGETLKSGQFWLRMGLKNMGVAPAGVEKKFTGHHHVIIDAPLPPFDEPIPADKNHVHFGGGQTETLLSLPPGRHKLQLLLGDVEHIPHNPALYSKMITVVVPGAPKSAAAPPPAAAGQKTPPAAAGQRTPPAVADRKAPTAAKGARVYILWPGNGQVLRGGKFWLRMGLKNMGIAPAGVAKKFTGHHHVIIDAPLPPFDEPIPADKNHVHYGGGQTEARVSLPPGRHTIQLLLGDEDHVPHNPPLYSKKVTVVVQPASERRPASPRSAPRRAAPRPVVARPAVPAPAVQPRDPPEAPKKTPGERDQWSPNTQNDEVQD